MLESLIRTPHNFPVSPTQCARVYLHVNVYVYVDVYVDVHVYVCAFVCANVSIELEVSSFGTWL